MTDSLRLSGSFVTTPATGNPVSMNSMVEAQLDERLMLSSKSVQEILLVDDVAVDVDLSAMEEVHVLFIKTVGGKVRVRVTSADGTEQAVAVDSLFMLISRTVPVTAIDLTRVSGVETSVRLFMGESAT